MSAKISVPSLPECAWHRAWIRGSQQRLLRSRRMADCFADLFDDDAAQAVSNQHNTPAFSFLDLISTLHPCHLSAKHPKYTYIVFSPVTQIAQEARRGFTHPVCIRTKAPTVVLPCHDMDVWEFLWQKVLQPHGGLWCPEP